ncbi:MAG: hypothetical protein H8K06_02475 [Nitrospira sp.]|nr:hypothetical protein [Nitrospira sp.]
MTDDEYISFLQALATKHLSPGGRQHPTDFLQKVDHMGQDFQAVSRLARLFKVVMDRPEDYSLASKFFEELVGPSSPVARVESALRLSKLSDALDDAGEVVFGELRRGSVPGEDVTFLRQAGFTDEEVEVFISIAIDEAHRLVRRDSLEFRNGFILREFKIFITKLPEPKELVQSSKKRKIFNGIGKILGGSVAGIGNALMATGTIVAPNPATAYGAIASAAVAVSGFFSGVGDLRGE